MERNAKPTCRAGTRRRFRDLGILALLPLVLGGLPAAGADLVLELSPTEATVGDHLQATLVVDPGDGASFEPVDLGTRFGPLEVVEGSWARRTEPSEEYGAGWVWRGTLAAYRTGSFEIPPIRLRVARGEASELLESAPVTVTIRSVLPEDAGPEGLEVADIRGPASIAPDYGPLRQALFILLILLGVTVVVWWLHRRFASRLAAVEQPDDLFERLPPHEWVYREMKRLLERRLAERGEIALFFSELSGILKRYLTGRLRVDLMEHTTEEVPSMLAQAGASEDVIGQVVDILTRCDMVKFAASRPDVDACKRAVEDVYRVVDSTRPAERGAA